jgi:2-succinyl-5-enolpyruvyl-6-hydroxy-3-cyclohexene-1-carboxylate synthase
VARIILDAAGRWGGRCSDPLSVCGSISHGCAPTSIDAALGGGGRSAAPEVVVRLGGLVSSKVTGQWLSAVPDQIAIDPAGWFPDPDRVVTHQVQAAHCCGVRGPDGRPWCRPADRRPAGWAERAGAR